jgi:plastocyanin
MFRIIACLACLGCVCGCGGGSDGGKTSVTVRIEQTRFAPKYATIASGGRVQWVNVDAVPHQVVSGTLDPQGSPLAVHTIQITLTGFNPTALTGNLGDTVQFSNISGNPFTMDVVDDNGQLVSTVSFAIGQSKTFTFPGAGQFVFRQHGSSIFQGTIILYGQPDPNGLFISPVLSNGEVFIAQFASTGSLSYYDLDQTNPNRSFKTGIITAH